MVSPPPIHAECFLLSNSNGNPKTFTFVVPITICELRSNESRNVLECGTLNVVAS